MKIPLILRLELAWVALTGHATSISMGPIPGTDRHGWRFELLDRKYVRHWERRNARLRKRRERGGR